jgi:hypothetical protein
MGIGMARLGQRMKPVFEPLEADRKVNMKGRAYLYLMIIGVASEFQGQGFGGKLLGALIEESEQVGLPVYLETATERNVRAERLNSDYLTNHLPVINLPQWELVKKKHDGGHAPSVAAPRRTCPKHRPPCRRCGACGCVAIRTSMRATPMRRR